MEVPFLDLSAMHAELESELIDATRRVIARSSFILGPEIEAFESEFARYSGVKHCIGVGNGFDALQLVLRAWGVGAGDEVLVPSQTAGATWMAVSEAGATPVPVDIDAVTFTLDPGLLEAAVSERCRAIIPVHLYGHPADMAPIKEFAGRHALLVLEDAAQGHGARYAGARCGSIGHAAAVSFYPTKNLGALGDGGAVLTSDDELALAVRKLRNYGSATKNLHESVGINSRLDELQAAFLRVKLNHLDRWIEQRRELARLYSEQLAGIEELRLPEEREGCVHAYHLYAVRTPNRDRLARGLAERKVQTLVHYPRTPRGNPVYRDLPMSTRATPVGDALARETLSLPLWPHMGARRVEFVCAAIHEVLGL